MKIRDLVIFVVGVGVGVGASYNIINKKLTAWHEEIIAEEKESIKEAYSNASTEKKEEAKEEPEQENKESEKEDTKTKYKELVKEYSEVVKEESSEIYEISIDEYGSEGYTEIELTYYIGDNTLTDDEDEPMSETDIVLSIGSLDILEKCKDGEYICVRNELKEVDYQIAISEDKFY